MVQPLLPELLGSATNLSAIRMHVQKTKFLRRPCPTTGDLRVWMQELKEAKALGRLIINESMARVDLEAEESQGDNGDPKLEDNGAPCRGKEASGAIRAINAI